MTLKHTVLLHMAAIAVGGGIGGLLGPPDDRIALGGVVGAFVAETIFIVALAIWGERG